MSLQTLNQAQKDGLLRAFLEAVPGGQQVQMLFNGYFVDAATQKAAALSWCETAKSNRQAQLNTIDANVAATKTQLNTEINQLNSLETAINA